MQNELSKQTLSHLKIYFILRWALIFLVIALVAGAFVFFGIAAGAAYIAQIIFLIFIVLFLVWIIAGKRIKDPL